ncbi:hypothetical protein CTAYLR_000896 [Chrysophaeum taylorii]|uniref:Methyltransferase type 11 domain-containing protein n=1 Tax=Chrysophaeum taylorii TaxID=2483200 RepID=A0AAD7XLH0_9STRA|nr:hypothetical protein CTAYLR_000896 [Chrysophaeum taylorii]
MEWVAAGGIALAGVHAIAVPFVLPAFRKHCLPYVAATAEQISLVRRACEARGVRHLVDLGSGDGVVCIEMARLGIRTHGVELNPILVWQSRLAARRANVGRLATFERGDLFRADISSADAVALFVVPAMMPDLEKKLAAELRPDALVLAGRFPLETWTPVDHLVHPRASSGYNVNQLWVYEPGLSISRM